MTLGPSHIDLTRERSRSFDGTQALDFLRNGLLHACHRLLDRARSDRNVLVATVPVPRMDPLALWQIDPTRTFGWYWYPSEGRHRCAIGVTEEICATGEERFDTIVELSNHLWSRVLIEPGSAPKPVLVGGFAFLQAGACGGAWSAFGDARFVLPRWSYVADHQNGWLCLALSTESAIDAINGELNVEMDELTRAISIGPSWHQEVGWQLVDEEHSPVEHWISLVERARRDISSGKLHKVVAARCGVLRADRTMDPTQVLRRLRRDNPACTTFGVRFGAATFLGATPETLVRKEGTSVRTEALAGTCQRAAAPDALLDSAKDRHEQHLVTEEIIRRLNPLCSSLRFPPEPTAQPLRRVVHLRTPIDGTLRGRTHVLELVKRLHPTPAVGGLPQDEALAWLEAHESMKRGWYASPVGWFDADGDGSFRVALRCGLIEGNLATVYAGAGLVRGSDPIAEHEETDWKLQAIRDALRGAGVCDERAG